ncbi:hypothetical protein WKW77_07215 [Variovorax ureilyticus]|uniref:Uncharacterized protein n=1 Tax=Variovorax ureilyticus TaxID=1836198 RepID=A0ABU8VBD3_9BURK
MTTSPIASRWLFLPLILAAVSFLVAAVEIFDFVASFARANRRTLDIALPSITLLLSALTLRLGMPCVWPLGKLGVLPKWMCWLALLFGAAIALLAGAELTYALMDAGIVVLLDLPVVMTLLLSLSCILLAYLSLRGQAQGTSRDGT